GEQRREQRQSVVARIAIAVNDARVRKHERNDTSQKKVCRHLVGDALRGCWRQPANSSDVAGTKLAQLVPRERRNTLRKLASMALRNASGEISERKQLVGTKHLRVTGQDLLDQRGSGARQADDEDR